MRIEHVRYLLEVARLGSISAAAKQLYMNQTTLSAIVAAAESEIGGPLFSRTPRGVLPTALGRKALPVLQTIRTDYDALLTLGGTESAAPGQVHLVSYACACRFWSLKASLLLREQGVDAVIVAHEASRKSVLDSVQDGTAAIGLGACTQDKWEAERLRAEHSRLTAQALFLDRPCVCVNRDSPLAGREEVSLEDLREQHLALSNCCLNKFYRSAGTAQISHLSVFSNMETVRSAVNSQGMVCILPTLAARPMEGEADTLTHIPLREVEPMVNYLLHRGAENLCLGERVVVDGVRAWCRDHFAPMSLGRG